MPVMHCRAQQTGWVSQYCLLQLTVQITALYAITMSAKMLPEKKKPLQAYLDYSDVYSI